MRVIDVRNVHAALPVALQLLETHGERRSTRNGVAYQVPGPVSTVYQRPLERVLFHPQRDANPFLHFYESLWMLAGRRDVASLTKYAKRFAQYSDDGVTFNAAYGWRWRSQVPSIIAILRGDPSTRQAVLQIWDRELDLGTDTRDHACNVAATFQVGSDGRLDVVVFCRSNDVVWGAYGANAVHFSYLLEYVAGAAGLSVGTYTQVSVNWHGYADVVVKLREKGPMAMRCPYAADEVTPYPLGVTPATLRSWDSDVRLLTSRQGHLPLGETYDNEFLRAVAVPIVMAHDQHVESNWRGAEAAIRYCEASDWRRACSEWLERRSVRRAAEAT